MAVSPRTMAVDPEIYQPKFGHPEEIIEYQPGLPMEHLGEALAMGRIVVAETFRPLVTDAHTLEVFPDKLVEERRSAHRVTFGRLLGAHEAGKRGKFRRQSLPVAVKPFASSDDALREMGGYAALRELGVPTFEPVGIFPSAVGSHVISMTVKNNDLISLDRTAWVVGRAVNSEQSMAQAERNNRQVMGIAETLAYIHAHGVFHPDGQIKNYVASAGDKIGVIDTEKQITKPLGDESSASLAWEDMEQLVGSLVIHNADEESGKTFGVGMLAHLPLHVVRSSIEELIIHPYLARLETMLGDAGAAQAHQIELLYDGLAEKFYNDESWPQHLIDVN